MERLRQTHSKEIESKDDEVEEIRQSCSKKVNGVIVELAMCANTARSHLVVFSTVVCSDIRPRVRRIILGPNPMWFMTAVHVCVRSN